MRQLIQLRGYCNTSRQSAQSVSPLPITFSVRASLASEMPPPPLSLRQVLKPSAAVAPLHVKLRKIECLDQILFISVFYFLKDMTKKENMMVTMFVAATLARVMLN